MEILSIYTHLHYNVLGPTGVLIQQHHYQAIPAQDIANIENGTVDSPILERNLSTSFNSQHSKTAATALQDCMCLEKIEFLKFFFLLFLDCKKRTNNHSNPTGHRLTMPPKNSSKSSTLLWGATGEQEWTPALTTGIVL